MGVSQIWAELGLVGHQAFQARHIGKVLSHGPKSQQLGPHRPPGGLQEVREMFAFLCIVSSDTLVLDMRPRVSCLQGAHKALQLAGSQRFEHSAGAPTGWG